MHTKKIVSIFLVAFTTLAAANFEPYELNGGLISAVAGDGYSIMATDTRMIGPGGYLLSSRNYLSSRIWSVDDTSIELMSGIESSFRSGDSDVGVVMDNNKQTTAPGIITMTMKHGDTLFGPTMIGAAGCAADCEALKRAIRADIKKSTQQGQLSSSPTADQVASCLSHTLYSRRGFPFYSFCCVAGMGGVFVFDAIGSYEQVAVASAGTGRESLQPILDRTFRSSQSDRCRVDCTVDEAIHGLVKAYRSVSEREIGVGDKLLLHITEKLGDAVESKTFVFPLKEH